MSATNLLADIEQFLFDTGMGPHRFGMASARNGRLIERLRAGRKDGRAARVWPETEAQIRDFMASERSRRATETTE